MKDFIFNAARARAFVGSFLQSLNQRGFDHGARFQALDSSSLRNKSMPFTQQQEAYLLQLFADGKAPYNNGKETSADRIKRVFDLHPTLQVGLSLRNFRGLYRRRACEYLTEEAQRGARRATGTATAPAAAPAAKSAASGKFCCLKS